MATVIGLSIFSLPLTHMQEKNERSFAKNFFFVDLKIYVIHREFCY